MDALAQQAQQALALVTDHAQDLVQQAQAAVASTPLQDAPQIALTKFQALTGPQRRNLGCVLGLAVLSALVKQKKAALLSLLINLVAFRVHALPLQTETSYDVVGALTNLSLAVFSVVNASSSASFTRAQVLNTAFGAAWAVRLGALLLTRILTKGKDDRFATIKTDRDALLFAFLMQAVWCYVGQLPLLVSNGAQKKESKEGEVKRSSWWPTVGRVLFVAGFAIETVSDAQKQAFAFHNNQRDSFISTGLWKYSRHPNYAGEILLQFGLTLACSEHFAGPLQRLAWLSPAFTAVLLTQISGIPMLEAASLKRFGSDAQYQQYLRDTPVLFPKIF